MYVGLAFTTWAGGRTIVVPPAAVQTPRDRHVVYLAATDDEGRFVQRSVTLGPSTADGYAILSGLQPGEVVVTEGRFFLRAEAVRNNPS